MLFSRCPLSTNPITMKTKARFFDSLAAGYAELGDFIKAVQSQKKDRSWKVAIAGIPSHMFIEKEDKISILLHGLFNIFKTVNMR